MTFYFVRGYVKDLAAAKKPARSAAAPVSTKTTPCPRCGKPVPNGTQFCGSCGAPLELWKVHRSTITVKKEGDEPADKGAPRPVINASLCIGCGTCVDVCPEDGALAMSEGKAILADRPKCTGAAKCKDSCPTSAISLAFGNVLQTVQVPRVNENFETNVQDVYIVGEPGGMGLIKTAINEGRLVMDYIHKKITCAQSPGHDARGQVDFSEESAPEPDLLADAVPEDAATEPDPDQPANVIIVGAGPAGLSAALTAQQHGLK